MRTEAVEPYHNRRRMVPGMTDDTARQAVRPGRRMGGGAIKLRVVCTSYHKHRFVPYSNLIATVLQFSPILQFRRNISAEAGFVPVHFGRSRNQAETVR